MASRVMHLAIANEICKEIQINDIERFRLGVILPDAYNHNVQSANDSHLKYTLENGTKKTYKLEWFRKTYSEKLKSDDLYLGYHLHLIQDTVFRYFVYSLHYWNPYPKGNIERLHNDYKLLNNYIVDKYYLCNSLNFPEDIETESIFDIYPFDLDQLSIDFNSDFKPYSNGKGFFFTRKMADEYIKIATQKCLEEIKALRSDSFAIDETEWAWDKNPPKPTTIQKNKQMTGELI